VANDDQFVEIERAEELNPSVPVMDGNYPVYRSREEPATARNITGIVHLNDFGSARSASASYHDWWMPDLYRAPEILMSVPWDFGVETWSIGILVNFSMLNTMHTTLLTVLRSLSFSKAAISSTPSTKFTTNTCSRWRSRNTFPYWDHHRYG